MNWEAAGLICGLFFIGAVAGGEATDAPIPYGTFGPWVVSNGTDPESQPLCTMMQNGDRERDPSITLMVMARLPQTVSVVLMRPLGGLGGLRVGDRFSVSSAVNNVTSGSTEYVMADDGFMAAGKASTGDLRRLVGDIATGKTWRWTIDAPAAHIHGMQVPLEGFIPAVNALADCSANIGVPF